MALSLPLARFGYTLHVFTLGARGLHPSRHVARLMCPDGSVAREWVTCCYRWRLPWKVRSLRYRLDGLIDPDDTLPVYYAELPPDRGCRQRLVLAR
jgi:hypothetical protein